MAIGSSGDVGRVRSPVSDLTSIKVHPAASVHAPPPAEACSLVPLPSRITGRRPGEFEVAEGQAAGLHVPTP